jgi:CDP-diacylglycerol---serine O-phosphatidyltransferase
MKKHIPNTITAFNLLCGCIAIIAAFHNQLVWSALLIGAAAFFDFLDGLFARILKVHSEIGKQLDSLADMVSFGLLPGIIMFQLISASLLVIDVPLFSRDLKGIALPSIALILPVFSAFRLAKFNIDTRQSDSFIGVPTPANAIFIGSLVLILTLQFKLDILTLSFHEELDAFVKLGKLNTYEAGIAQAIFHPYALIGNSIIFSFLLISEIPLFALKFKNLNWNENKHRFIFLGISIALILLFKFIGLALSILVYIFLSIILNFGISNSKQ